MTVRQGLDSFVGNVPAGNTAFGLETGSIHRRNILSGRRKLPLSETSDLPAKNDAIDLLITIECVKSSWQEGGKCVMRCENIFLVAVRIGQLFPIHLRERITI